MNSTTHTKNGNGSFDVFNEIAEIIKPCIVWGMCYRVKIDRSVFINDRKVDILEPGMKVCIVDNVLSNGTGTHEIKHLSVSGNKYSLTAIEIETGQLIGIDL